MDSGSKVRVVFLTVHEDPDFARAASDSGAYAFVVKSRMAADLSRRFVRGRGRSGLVPSRFHCRVETQIWLSLLLLILTGRFDLPSLYNSCVLKLSFFFWRLSPEEFSCKKLRRRRPYLTTGIVLVRWIRTFQQR